MFLGFFLRMLCIKIDECFLWYFVILIEKIPVDYEVIVLWDVVFKVVMLAQKTQQFRAWSVVGDTIRVDVFVLEHSEK